MKYLSTTFTISPCTATAQDLLAAILGDAGYDSFVYTDSGMEAYIQLNSYDESTVKGTIKDFILPDTHIDFHSSEVETEDWNSAWEQEGFSPIIIDGLCCIHSERHKDLPDLPYDIVINPRMAFGTGSHETTRTLVEILLNEDFRGKSVLDMGCGTCVLGIAMAKRGAAFVTAIDIDDMSVENAKANCSLNGISNVNVVLGDAGSIGASDTFDCIVANIHKNIIMADMPVYASHIAQGGTLLISGFYEADKPELIDSASRHGLRYTQDWTNNGWAVVKFEKQ